VEKGPRHVQKTGTRPPRQRSARLHGFALRASLQFAWAIWA